MEVLGCLQFGAISDITTNIPVCAFAHISIGNKPRSRTAGFQGMFSFRRYWQMAIPSGRTQESQTLHMFLNTWDSVFPISAIWDGM